MAGGNRRTSAFVRALGLARTLLYGAARPRDPAARGLALSGTAHGGAVLCLSDEREAFPFAALMMSLGAACSVGLLTVAPVRALVLRVALGQAV